MSELPAEPAREGAEVYWPVRPDTPVLVDGWRRSGRLRTPMRHRARTITHDEPKEFSTRDPPKGIYGALRRICATFDARPAHIEVRDRPGARPRHQEDHPRTSRSEPHGEIVGMRERGCKLLGDVESVTRMTSSIKKTVEGSAAVR